MLSVMQLWLPIILSAIAVFIASSVVHMVIKWHNSDYRKLPNEDEVRACLKSASGAPGMYFVPHMGDMKEMRKPENVQKFVDGPIALITIRPPGAPKMGPQLTQWFILGLFVSAIAGYLASKTVPADASFLAVCRPVSIVAFMAYGVGALINGIWWGKSWSSVVKEVLDAIIYSAITACVFAALWPGAAA
jgi:hypothetical protein